MLPNKNNGVMMKKATSRKIFLIDKIVTYFILSVKFCVVSGRWESDPLPSPWQGDVLPVNYARIIVHCINFSKKIPLDIWIDTAA